MNVINIVRYWSTVEENGVTLSKVFLNGTPFEFQKRQVFILEDEFRIEKVSGETRIPAGLYKIGLKTTGSHHEKYKAMFPDFHVGMIEILNVPKFTDILMHIGNIEKDTEGCSIVGNIVGELGGKTAVLNSKGTYIYLYKLIVSLLSIGDVYFNYIDLDLSKN